MSVAMPDAVLKRRRRGTAERRARLLLSVVEIRGMDDGVAERAHFVGGVAEDVDDARAHEVERRTFLLDGVQGEDDLVDVLEDHRLECAGGAVHALDLTL